MNCVNLLKICLLMITVLAQAKIVLSRNRGKFKLNSTNKNGPFDPCKTTVNIPSSQWKRITKLALSIISSCTTRVSPLIGDDWGSPEKLLSFFPRFENVICVLLRVLYALSSNSNGRLPQRVALNASRMYDVGYRMLYATLTDHSKSARLCSRKRTPDRMEQYCYPKSQLLRAINLLVPCMREVMKNSVPEYGDTVIYAMAFSIKVIRSNGVLNYLFG